MKSYAELVRSLTESVLRTPGDTDPRLRQSVAGRAAEIGGLPSAAGEVPADLAPLVDKIARHAYEVTEEDLAALQKAGYSDDALFEITVSGALGAARARLERGLAALRGDTP